MSMPYDKMMNTEHTDDFIRFMQFKTQKTGANSRVPPICSDSGQFHPAPRNSIRLIILILCFTFLILYIMLVLVSGY